MMRRLFGHSTLFSLVKARRLVALLMAMAVLSTWCSPALADKTDAKPQPPAAASKPTPWTAAWHWEAKDRQPILVVTIANRAKRPLRVGPFRVEGKQAGEFSPVRKDDVAKAAELAPAGSTTLRWFWHRDPARTTPIDAALCFDVGLSADDKDKTGASVGRIDLAKPFGAIPYKFVADAFFDRAAKPVARDAQGRIRTDDGYHDDAMVDAIVRAFAQDRPDIVTLHELGTSCQGRKILALEITSNKKKSGDKPSVAFLGAHHGGELISTEFVLDTIGRLVHRYDTDPEVGRWVDDCRIWCVPLVNPDGLHQYFHDGRGGRKNGRDTSANGRFEPGEGVDLNRNYPFRWHALGEKGSSGQPAHGRYRGPSPASEPETKAMMRLADRERFVLLVSYHTSGSRVLVPYTIDGARNPHPDAAWIVGATMAALSDTARADRDYEPARKLYSVDGTDQDWHYWRHGTLAYIWEGSMSSPLSPKTRNAVVSGIRPGWEFLLKRIASGPTLSGRVRDAVSGKPLEAVVSIEEIHTFEGERHTSQPGTGRFDRILPIEGTYHLRVAKDGYRPARVKVDLAHEWKTLDVALEPLPAAPARSVDATAPRRQ